MVRRLYTKEDTQWLINNRSEKSLNELATYLNRSIKSISPC